MKLNKLGLYLEDDIIVATDILFKTLIQNIEWNETIQARKTASIGVPYNYSGIEYDYVEMTPELDFICMLIENEFGWKPNNCLLNLYENGNNTMGWHFDRTDILEDGTGVCIVSLGSTRTLQFRQIENKMNKAEYELKDGSLFMMTDKIQDIYHHRVPKSESTEPRISLTFRKLI